MNPIRASLKYKQVTLSVLALMFAAGIYSLFTMPRREDPKITIRQGLVIAYYPGASSIQTEAQLTKTLEDYLFQFEEVRKDKTFSTTQDGLAVINVSLEDNVSDPNVFWNTLRHQLIVARQLDLPQGVIGPIVDSDFGDTEAMLIGLESQGADYAQLRQYVRKIENYLLPVNAVSKIKIIGDQPQQISILFNSQLLSRYGVNEVQIIRILQSQNLIGPTGDINTTADQVPLYVTGYYRTEDEVANQIVGTSPTGQVVRLHDVAEIRRSYAEPTSTITINGQKALVLSLQMEEGNNIVKFGKAVNQRLDEVQQLLPSDVKLVTFVNQPNLVSLNVNDFIREFLLAIVSVIIVIILLLPIRVAGVAAMAIPMTIAVTIALMNLLGVELHQVSLAALIVVLGMVVDDAIVIADNYVELLDKGEKPWDAAWRSASEMVIPVFSATITIIAAFIPITLLTGMIGEFISALPITVTIALGSSFTVAMLFTPMLCYTFIKKGLTSEDDKKKNKKKRKSFLDIIQALYDKALDAVIKIPRIVIIVSALTVVLAGVIYLFGIKQRFFPAAERNQFVIELWMPTGTSLDRTTDNLIRLEQLLTNDDRVTNYTTFAGEGAPRFYYNFSPEFPVSNYGMILVNTTTNKAAEVLRDELLPRASRMIAEGMVDVKLMQQGQPQDAPVEVRISGTNLDFLQTVGDSVKAIFRRSIGSRLIRSDFHEPYYGISVNLTAEAPRLGFTTQSVSQMIYAAFNGAPVTTMYEGDRKINVQFRVREEMRRSAADLSNLYLTSPATGASVPLRQIATLSAEWNPGRIIHRNGIRTLTVQSETDDATLPSELLGEVRPEVEKLNLPPGYSISYGGEYGNQQEIMGQLINVMLVSIMLIFFILLFQFRNIKESIIVMLTIPFSLLGAMLGLFITGNNFGFTAFIGIISLSGVVVRNAIILVDYANSMQKEGMTVKEAAIESGRRRLRPIFLTAMAAAIGVFPMILSGSSMWSPMASVIAAGVIWSMFMSLLTIPVIYTQWVKPKKPDGDGNTTPQTDVVPAPQQENEKNGNNLTMRIKRTIRFGKRSPILLLPAALFTFMAVETSAQVEQAPGRYLQNEPSQTGYSRPTHRPTLTLTQVVDSAWQNNHLLRAAEWQVRGKETQVNSLRIKAFPALFVSSTYLYSHNVGKLRIDRGALGNIPLGSLGDFPIPLQDTRIPIGNHHFFTAGAFFYQPLTQQFKINSGIRAARADMEASAAEADKARQQIRLGAEQLYYGILISEKQAEEARLRLELAQIELYDLESALLAGETVIANRAGLQAEIADKEKDLMKLEMDAQNYRSRLRQLTGIDGEINLVYPQQAETYVSLLSLEDYKAMARANNVDLRILNKEEEYARLGRRATRQGYIPDVGLFGGYAYVNGADLFANNTLVLGVNLTWNIQDIFSNNQSVRQIDSQLGAVREKRMDTELQVYSDLESAYRNVNYSHRLIDVARREVEYRREDLKVKEDRALAGMNTRREVVEALADLAKAEGDLYAAQLGYILAYNQLRVLSGEIGV